MESLETHFAKQTVIFSQLACMCKYKQTFQFLANVWSLIVPIMRWAGIFPIETANQFWEETISHELCIFYDLNRACLFRCLPFAFSSLSCASTHGKRAVGDLVLPPSSSQQPQIRSLNCRHRPTDDDVMWRFCLNNTASNWEMHCIHWIHTTVNCRCVNPAAFLIIIIFEPCEHVTHRTRLSE